MITRGPCCGHRVFPTGIGNLGQPTVLLLPGTECVSIAGGGLSIRDIWVGYISRGSNGRIMPSKFHRTTGNAAGLVGLAETVTWRTTLLGA
jgi:hypothetical protein